MKIDNLTALVVAPEPPWPILNGGHARMYQLIRSMAEFCELDVVTLAPPCLHIDPKETQLKLKAKSLTVVRHSPPAKVLMAIKGLLTSKPLGALLYRSEPMHVTVAAISKRNQYDICLILGNLCMAQYAAHIQARMLVLDMCDDVSLYYDRRAEIAGNISKRAYYRLQGKVIRSYLTRKSSAISKILAVSKLDAKSISQYVGVEVVTVPNYVDEGVFRPKPRIVSAPHDPRLLFVGAMSSWANRDAVEWFASSIMPSILQEIPGTQLHVVGPGTDRLAIESTNVILRGFAEDLASEYRKCDVFVCPLRVGAGIKNKLMEALASGCAIVSTDIGIEGFNVRNDEHLLVANSPLDFARAVSRLVSEPELRTRLGNAARAFAEKALSERTMGDSMRAAILSKSLNACSEPRG